ncbi:MAG: hypothetical protein JWL83_1156 [Actinomycetia bacterium]|jgi:hypothetical protein|nr:hypothetical protein [Actinomycetes bacterium]
MDDAGLVWRAAVHGAVERVDVAELLPALTGITRQAQPLRAAVQQVDRELRNKPNDVVLRRARALLTGALSDTIFTERRHERSR